MKLPSKIQYINYQDIDKGRWDECIRQAANSRIYALSGYLDTMCTQWNALISGDYEVIMPLPCRSKFGLKYLYRPAFTQQLGVFAAEEISAEIVEMFLDNIPARFRYRDIALNSGNCLQKFESRPAKNYLLPLHQPYEDLVKQYNRNAKRNIKKAVDAGITIAEHADFDLTIALHRKRFNDSLGADENDYKNLHLLLDKLNAPGLVFSICAKNKSNEVIASSTYVLHNNRIIFLINGNLTESLQTGATHLLKDFAIRKFAGRNLVVDFEGSDHPTFANFYMQFGGKQVEYYPVIVDNKLPLPIKYLKRSSPAL